MSSPEGKTGPSHLFRRALAATSCPRLARLRLRQYCLECDVPMWTQRGVTELPHTGSDCTVLIVPPFSSSAFGSTTQKLGLVDHRRSCRHPTLTTFREQPRR